MSNAGAFTVNNEFGADAQSVERCACLHQSVDLVLVQFAGRKNRHSLKPRSLVLKVS
jgi:hypothetical protein